MGQRCCKRRVIEVYSPITEDIHSTRDIHSDEDINSDEDIKSDEDVTKDTFDPINSNPPSPRQSDNEYRFRVYTKHQSKEDIDDAKPRSMVAMNFINRPLDTDLQTVPGIGSVHAAKLRHQGITTPIQLVAEYFRCGRQTDEFLNLLLSFGIRRQYARETVLRIDQKFRTI